MKMFEINEFRRLLKELFDLKQRTEPYNYQEWFTGGANASQCKNILDSMRAQITALVKSAKLDNGYSFKVDYSKGAGRFPRVPWIAILFNKEKPTNAVYPVLAFNKDNWYVACVESFKNPQEDFYEKLSLNDLNEKIDVAVVKFEFSEEMKEKAFSLLKAMQITPRSIFPDINGLAQSVTWDISGNLKD